MKIVTGITLGILLTLAYITNAMNQDKSLVEGEGQARQAHAEPTVSSAGTYSGNMGGGSGGCSIAGWEQLPSGKWVQIWDCYGVGIIPN